MLKLYSYNSSICAQKVRITLAEKGLSFDTENIDLFTNEQFKPAYLKINPKGVVPALDHDGRIVIESSLICEYLDEEFPEPRLTPDDAFGRARMRLWSKEVDEHLFEATRELSFSAMFRERMRSMTEEQRATRFNNVGDPIKRERLMSTYAEGVESPYVYQGIANFEVAFAKMEKELIKGPWLLGERMTLADINMMPFVARLNYLGLLEAWTDDRPATKAWWERARALRSFRVSITEKTTEAEAAAMKQFGSVLLERVRQRRDDYLRQPKAAA